MYQFKRIMNYTYTPAFMVSFVYMSGLYYLCNRNDRVKYQNIISDKYPRIIVTNNNRSV